MQTWQDYLDFEDANQTAMHTAIRELARRRPKQHIIVRPHPGEDLKRWDGLFGECPNVKVIREGAHLPWTMACRLLLHTSCTTGFEAQVAGKVAFSLVHEPAGLPPRCSPIGSIQPFPTRSRWYRPQRPFSTADPRHRRSRRQLRPSIMFGTVPATCDGSRSPILLLEGLPRP